MPDTRARMKNLGILLIILMLIALSCCTDRDGGPVSTVTRFDLTPKEITAMKTKADNGDGEAAKRLAEYNNYVAHDQEQAFSWYKKSAELGNADSQFILARRYLRDKKDKDQALYWFKKASNKGNADARQYVEVFFATPEEKNAASQKAMSGDGVAAYRLSQHFALIDKNRELEEFWAKKSAENGNPDGQVYYSSQLTGEERLYWLRKAADGGSKIAKDVLRKESAK